MLETRNFRHTFGVQRSPYMPPLVKWYALAPNNANNLSFPNAQMANRRCDCGADLWYAPWPSGLEGNGTEPRVVLFEHSQTEVTVRNLVSGAGVHQVVRIAKHFSEGEDVNFKALDKQALRASPALLSAVDTVQYSRP